MSRCVMTPDEAVRQQRIFLSTKNPSIRHNALVADLLFCNKHKEPRIACGCYEIAEEKGAIFEITESDVKNGLTFEEAMKRKPIGESDGR